MRGHSGATEGDALYGCTDTHRLHVTCVSQCSVCGYALCLQSGVGREAKRATGAFGGEYRRRITCNWETGVGNYMSLHVITLQW